MPRSKTPLEPCPQCGRPVRIGAYRCQGCNAVLSWDTEELARMATPSTAVRKALEREFDEEEKALREGTPPPKAAPVRRARKPLPRWFVPALACGGGGFLVLLLVLWFVLSRTGEKPEATAGAGEGATGTSAPVVITMTPEEACGKCQELRAGMQGGPDGSLAKYREAFALAAPECKAAEIAAFAKAGQAEAALILAAQAKTADPCLGLQLAQFIAARASDQMYGEKEKTRAFAQKLRKEGVPARPDPEGPGIAYDPAFYQGIAEKGGRCAPEAGYRAVLAGYPLDFECSRDEVQKAILGWNDYLTRVTGGPWLTAAVLRLAALHGYLSDCQQEGGHGPEMAEAERIRARAAGGAAPPGIEGERLVSRLRDPKLLSFPPLPAGTEAAVAKAGTSGTLIRDFYSSPPGAVRKASEAAFASVGLQRIGAPEKGGDFVLAGARGDLAPEVSVFLPPAAQDHEWVRVAVLQGRGESGGTSVTIRTLYLHRPAGGIWEAVTEGATGGGQLLQVIADRLAEEGEVPTDEYR